MLLGKFCLAILGKGKERGAGKEREGIGAEKSERQASGKGGKAPALAGGTSVRLWWMVFIKQVER